MLVFGHKKNPTINVKFCMWFFEKLCPITYKIQSFDFHLENCYELYPRFITGSSQIKIVIVTINKIYVFCIKKKSQNILYLFWDLEF